METAERKTSLDVIRIAACFLVVAMHSPMPGASGIVQNLIYTVTAPCIGLFFMVSGALLLPCEGGWSFVRKRFKKVLVPTLVWTVFYLAANILLKHQSLSELPRQIASIPFSPQGTGVLWFMYVLCGLYLLAPILSPWLVSSKRKDIEILLAIWGITLLFPLLENWLAVNHTVSSPFYYFTGYAGYFILGYYITRFKVRFTWLKDIAALAAVFLFLGAVKFLPLGIGYEKAISYLSLPTVVATLACFSMLEKFGEKIPSGSAMAGMLAKLSGLSFGVYLSHIFFIRYLLWERFQGGAVQIIATIAITLAGSFAVSYLISLLPFGRFITGYQTQKKVENLKCLV